MSRKYSVIVFDLGNVLVPFDYTNSIEKLEATEKNLGKKFWEFYKGNYDIHRQFERGKISKEKFIDLMLASIENKIDSETFCKYYAKIFTVNEDVVSLLPELKKNYLLVLLSNTNCIHHEYGWKDFEFLKYFDKQILSHLVGAVKPEENIYKEVESFTGKPPEEHIFIDDIAEYTEKAKSRGWDAIRFKNYEELLSELKQRKIL
jgi:putative hydrolase of the HAD superfamily